MYCIPIHSSVRICLSSVSDKKTTEGAGEIAQSVSMSKPHKHEDPCLILITYINSQAVVALACKPMPRGIDRWDSLGLLISYHSLISKPQITNKRPYNTIPRWTAAAKVNLWPTYTQVCTCIDTHTQTQRL